MGFRLGLGWLGLGLGLASPDLEVGVERADEREAREEDVPPPLDRLERVEEGVRVRARARLGLGLG